MAPVRPPVPKKPKELLQYTLFVPNDNYGDFIRLVRQDVIKDVIDKLPKQPGTEKVLQPVLPPEETEKKPLYWIHIVLKTDKNSSITLAIRVDNLYLVGFKTQSGVWWEFVPENGGPRLIAGSTSLGFGGRYADLIGNHVGLDTVALGRGEMAAAVDALAEHGTTRPAHAQPQGDAYALPKSKLAKLVIMLSEGIRFHTVYGTVDREFDGVAPARMTEVEGKQVNEWRKISEAVIKWGDDREAKFPKLEEIGIKDVNDAARVVAIVKGETS